MPTINKENHSNISIGVGVISVDDSDTDRGGCWKSNLSNQFPIIGIYNEDGEATVTCGPPHEGYSIHTILRNGIPNGESYILNKDNIRVATLSFVEGVATGPCMLYDDVGRLFFEGYYLNGYREAKGIEFDEDGSVVFEGFFKEGKKLNIVRIDGMEDYWKEMNNRNEIISICQKNDRCGNEGICYFFSNGVITRISEWKDGKEVSDCGECRIYDEPHGVFFEGYFENGLQEGRGKEFDEDGNVVFDGFFKEGKKLNIVRMDEMEGYWKEMNDKNEIVSICQKNDRCVNEGICYFYSNGVISRISKWKDGKEVSDCGQCRIYDEPHEVFFEGYFENGLQERRGKEIDLNGNVVFEGFFKEGKKLNIVRMDGMEDYWKEMNNRNEKISICQKNDHFGNEGICYFYENGKIEKVSEWKNGVEMIVLKRFDGEKMMEFEDGVKRYEGQYKDSVVNGYPREGSGKEFDEDGNTVLYRGSFLNGHREGEGLEYKNGQIIYEGNWKDGKRNGKGKEYKNGMVIYESNWKDDERGVMTIDKSSDLSGIDEYVIKVVISSNCCNDVASLNWNNCKMLQSIEIGDECFEKVDNFTIDGINNLKSIKIGINSFTKKKNTDGNDPSRSFHILNCEKLESIEIGKYSFSDYSGQFELKNLPSLSTLIIGDRFCGWNFHYSSFVVKDLPNLQSIQLGSFAFCHSLSTVISNLPNLKSIQLGAQPLGGSDGDDSCSLEMKDLPKLQEIINSDGRGFSFCYPRSVILSNIPNLKRVNLPNSFQYVQTKSISNVSWKLSHLVKIDGCCCISF